MLRAPFSSEFDPSEEAEGSIDPLGLNPGYERLANRLLPAVTVRMGNPRFVTAIAIGAGGHELAEEEKVFRHGLGLHLDHRAVRLGHADDGERLVEQLLRERL